MPRKPTAGNKITSTEVAGDTAKSGGLIPKAFDYLSCNVADLESQISFLDEDLGTIINKERPDLAKVEPRENLCDLASDVLILADRIYSATERLRNIRDNLEL